MRNFRTPFLFNLNDIGSSPSKRTPAPFLPSIARIRETPGNPYPDAFRLPLLPLPLLMRVARFNRKMSFPRLLPLPRVIYSVSGITKDSTGVALPSCDVNLFTTSDDAFRYSVTSGADGSYKFIGGLISPSKDHYCVAYKAGSPDVAGTTQNDLKGS
jgi:hypothetical protein